MICHLPKLIVIILKVVIFLYFQFLYIFYICVYVCEYINVNMCVCVCPFLLKSEMVLWTQSLDFYNLLKHIVKEFNRKTSFFIKIIFLL